MCIIGTKTNVHPFPGEWKLHLFEERLSFVPAQSFSPDCHKKIRKQPDFCRSASDYFPFQRYHWLSPYLLFLNRKQKITFRTNFNYIFPILSTPISSFSSHMWHPTHLTISWCIYMSMRPGRRSAPRFLLSNTNIHPCFCSHLHMIGQIL